MEEAQSEPALGPPSGVRFTHAASLQAFRLLELPDELLASLDSGKASRIVFKSPPPRSSALSANSRVSSTQGTAEPFVNLCTDTKTYSLRQVHSSNSIFVIEPLPSPRTSSESGSNDATDGVAAIALCKSTLEVLKLGSGETALSFLLKNLQVYDAIDLEEDAMDVDSIQTPSVAKRQEALEKLFADVPFSTAECYQAWIDICGFVHPDNLTENLGCWRPSAAGKLSAWKQMIEGAVLQGLDLEQQFLVHDLWRATTDDEASNGTHEFPKDLFDAVVRRLMEQTSDDRVQVSLELKWASLCKKTTINWVGNTYLEAIAPEPQSAIPLVEFQKAWKDLVPEKWRKDVKAEAKVNFQLGMLYEIIAKTVWS